MTIAKKVKPILIELARYRQKIAYSDLAELCGLRSNRGGGPRLFEALDEISKQEVSAGNGMLSAMVVKKIPYGSGLGRPGQGFFELARKLGRLGECDRKSERDFWESELAKVFRKYSK